MRCDTLSLALQHRSPFRIHKYHKFSLQLHESCSQSSPWFFFFLLRRFSPSNQLWFSFSFDSPSWNVKFFIFRSLRKRRSAQRPARGFDSRSKSWQSCFVGPQSNQRTGAHSDAENSPATHRAGRHFWRARVESDGPVNAHQLTGYGAEEYHNRDECCWRHSSAVDGNFVESHFECKSRHFKSLMGHLTSHENLCRKEINTSWFAGLRLSQSWHCCWCSARSCLSVSLVIHAALWYYSRFVDSSLLPAHGWCLASICRCRSLLVTCALTQLTTWFHNHLLACPRTFSCTTHNVKAFALIRSPNAWGSLKPQLAVPATRWTPWRKCHWPSSRSSRNPN